CHRLANAAGRAGDQSRLACKNHPSSSLSFKSRQKETIRTVLSRRYPQHWTGDRWGPIQQFCPELGQGDQPKVRRAGEKGIRLLFVFFTEQRAGCIGQASAWTNQSGGAFEDRGLK